MNWNNPYLWGAAALLLILVGFGIWRRRRQPKPNPWGGIGRGKAARQSKAKAQVTGQHPVQGNPQSPGQMTRGNVGPINRENLPLPSQKKTGS